MESFLTFSPPQAPPMTSAAQLAAHVSEKYPELGSRDAHLSDLVAALGACEFASREYQARNAHYAEWMQWYKENPTQKDVVIAFAVEHNVYFDAIRGALLMLDAAVGRLIEAWGDRSDLTAIRTVLRNVENEAQRLADNLKALQSSSNPTGRPQILPQKRPSSNR